MKPENNTSALDSELDPFILHQVSPEANELLGFEHKSIKEIIDTADIVLDTNILLRLLVTGTNSIAEVEKIYARLIKEKRIYIPAQVAREYTKNRSEKIKNLYHDLAQKKQLQISVSYYPLFEGLEEFKKLAEQEKVLLEKYADYQKNVSDVLNAIKNWGSSDPVSQMYKRVGLHTRVLHSKHDQKAILAEMNRRYLHKLPPGYKDGKKEDRGIGDFLLWNEILELGKTNKKDLIFITGEEKSDWWDRSDGSRLHIRYELVDEFRRSSQGKSFQILNFSDFLEYFGATDAVINQAKAEQLSSSQIDEVNSVPLEVDDESQKTKNSLWPDFPAFVQASELAVKIWMKNKLSRFIKSINSSGAWGLHLAVWR